MSLLCGKAKKKNEFFAALAEGFNTLYIVEDDGDGNVRRRNVVLNEAEKVDDTNGEYKGWLVDIEGQKIDVYGAFVAFEIGDDEGPLSTYDGLSIVAPNLERLDCYGNNLTSLDVSKNVALTALDCSTNNLTSLDVSKNVALTYLNCSSNNLTSLDVSKNVALTALDCSTNNLTSLDVSNNVALTYLYFSSNNLTSLDVSKNLALTYLDCGSNQLTSLDVSNNVALTYLNCIGNTTVTTLSIASEYGNASVSTGLAGLITAATSTTGTLNIYGGDNTTVHTAATTKGWTVNTNL